jgi:HEAT repeat protein
MIACVVGGGPYLDELYRRRSWTSSVSGTEKTPASYAEFDDAREGGVLRTIVQFFAIPLLIVCVAVALYLGISVMVGTGPRTASDFVEVLQSDTINRRWQAAAELAARLSGEEVPEEFRDPRLVRALTTALDSARAEEADPPRLAVLLLGILRRLEDPAALDAVRDALDDKHPWVRSHAILALGALGDRESIPRLTGEFARHTDPGTRQATLSVLARLDQVEGLEYRLSRRTRELALESLGDRNEDVRFTAALILAEAGEKEAALPVLTRMLDRSYLEQFPLDGRLSGISQYDLHTNLILKAIRAVASLDCGDQPKVRKALEVLSDSGSEGDPEVRRRARSTLEALRGKAQG